MSPDVKYVAMPIGRDEEIAMENHLYDIVRFVCYLLALIIPVVVMTWADDRSLVRWMAAASGSIAIYYNRTISMVAYQMIGALMETVAAIMGMGFIIALMVAIVLLPLVLLARLLLSR
jgi:hypothetical protein